MPDQWAAVTHAPTVKESKEVPFLGTEAGLFSLILPCVMLLIALGNILKGDDDAGNR